MPLDEAEGAATEVWVNGSGADGAVVSGAEVNESWATDPEPTKAAPTGSGPTELMMHNLTKSLIAGLVAPKSVKGLLST